MFDAGTIALVNILVGILGITASASLIRDHGSRAAVTVLIGTFMAVSIVFSIREDTKGTLAELEIGTNYTYQVDEWFTSNLFSGAVARIIDQDRELAFYRVPCLNIRGGCKSIPKDGTAFQIVDGGNDLVIVPIQPKSKED